MISSQSVVVFGKDGQLGKAFQKILSQYPNVVFIGRNECDLTKAEQIQGILEKFQPQIIINASAYTAVDQAEKEPEIANLVNGEALKIISEYLAQKEHSFLFHYSTDYVFDGLKNLPYDETDTTNPLGQNGKSKLSGELAIQQSFKKWASNNFSKYYILRTSWVYGEGNNFIRTMLRLASEREQIKVISDQFGVPTSAQWIAQVSMRILEISIPSGIYHTVPDGETSWHGLARFAIDSAIQEGKVLKIKPENILAIPATDYPLPAPRPYNSRMNNQKLKLALKEDFPYWKNQVQEYIKNTLG